MAYLSLIWIGVLLMTGPTTFLISKIPVRLFAPDRAIFLPLGVIVRLTGAV